MTDDEPKIWSAYTKFFQMFSRCFSQMTNPINSIDNNNTFVIETFEGCLLEHLIYLAGFHYDRSFLGSCMNPQNILSKSKVCAYQ